MNFEEFLQSPMAYLAPEKALEGLTAQQAETKPHDAPHSIAEVVAHMAFWQKWFCYRIEGVDSPMAEHAAEGWPAVIPGSWPELHASFVEDLATLVKLSKSMDQTAPVTPAIPFPPMTNYTMGEALTHVALHNAHHIGQVITLRQIQGLWPPPAGSWTW
ncbi:hypothetical protein F183_A06050 [Bryobacterales bacterium F-183]|nr:hypothetical protein F183_A06050 [Bryobacterales bacterium F-183]